MWTVIFVSRDPRAVKRIENEFNEHEILVRVRTVTGGGYEILVPDTEKRQAQDLLVDIMPLR